MSDISAALTASLAKDGQTVPTANLPMGGFKHTGVANPTARDQYATVDQVQDGDYLAVGSVGGTANAITGSLSPAISAYVARMMVVLIPTSTNTGATTLALNGLTALDVFNIDGSACVGGELVSGVPVTLVLDSGADDWVIANPANVRLSMPVSFSDDLTLDATHSSRSVYYLVGSPAGKTLTLPSSVLPVGSIVNIYNASANSFTLAASGTLVWYTGAATSTGSRTIGFGAALSAHHFTSSIWNISGQGIT